MLDSNLCVYKHNKSRDMSAERVNCSIRELTSVNGKLVDIFAVTWVDVKQVNRSLLNLTRPRSSFFLVQWLKCAFVWLKSCD